MVMYIYQITAAENSISWQEGSPCQGNEYGMEKAGGTSITFKITPAGHSPLVSQAGRRVGPALWPSASLVITGR